MARIGVGFARLGSVLTCLLRQAMQDFRRARKPAVRYLRKPFLGLLLLILMTTLTYAEEPSPQASSAEVAKLISYQGRVSRPDGTPVTDGTYQMFFALYDTPMGGGAVWSETQMILVQNGAFGALLGQVEPFDPALWDGTSYWLETWIEGQLLSPRLAIASTPYAFTVLPGAVVQGDLDDEPILTIENESPVPAATGIQATTQIGHAVYGVSTDGVGVDGYSKTGRGVNGVSETGDGVFGHAQGDGVGVRGLSHSGDGVQGISETGPFGVRGVSESGQTGVVGVSEGPPTASDTAMGVSGVADDEHGIGVFGSSINGWPIKGITPSEHPAIWGDNTGSGMGVFGTSVGGPGVRGKSVNDFAVVGQSENGEASVFGWSINPVGVRGQSAYSDGVYGTSNDGRGVYGKSSSAAGVYGESIGDVGVYGTSDNHEGVSGWSLAAAGVLGTSVHDIGVKGTTSSDKSANPAVLGENTGGGIGVKGTSTSGSTTVPAMLGENQGSGPGVQGTSTNGPGVAASSTNEDGVEATTSSSNPLHAAVRGTNNGQGQGVRGVSQTSWGVAGITYSSWYTMSAIQGQNYGAGHGVAGKAQGNVSAIIGENTSTGNGVYGESAEGHGIRGISYAITSDKASVLGENFGNGFGVVGEARGVMAAVKGYNSSTGVGTYGDSEGGDGAVGHTESTDATRAGVFGLNEGTGYGVYGDSSGPWGVAGLSRQVWTSGQPLGQPFGAGGQANANSGFGVTGLSYSGPAGVLGATAWSASGQVGYVTDHLPIGVAGVSWTGTGVYGSSQNDIGVIARTGSADNYALASYGSAWIGGNLIVTGGKSGYVVDLALNDDSQALEAGDVVIVTGAAAPVLGDIPVPKVRRADRAACTAVIGVVDKHYTFEQPEISALGEEGGRSDSIALFEAERDMSGPGEPSTEGEASSDHAERAVREPSSQEPRLIDEPAAPGEYVSIVTLGAYARIKVDASDGAIQPGDLLVASATPGHAMKGVDPSLGTVIGKALETMSSGRGTIPVLVNLQ